MPKDDFKDNRSTNSNYSDAVGRMPSFRETQYRTKKGLSMRDKIEVQYHYFKESGKWYASGSGVPIPVNVQNNELTHDKIRALNGGCLPGLAESSNGKEFYVFIADDTAFPRMIKPRRY